MSGRISVSLRIVLIHASRSIGFFLLGYSALGNGLDGLTGTESSLCTVYYHACLSCDSLIVTFDRVADLIATKSYRHYQ
jgi:hypothetical protein